MGGQEDSGVGSRGSWGAEGRIKQPFELKELCYAFSM